MLTGSRAMRLTGLGALQLAQLVAAGENSCIEAVEALADVSPLPG